MSNQPLDDLREKIAIRARATMQAAPLKIIFNTFADHPGKLGFVGGAIRDWCLDVQPEDWDLLWQGEFATLVEQLERTGISTRLRPDYLTLTCNIGGHDIDIAVTRDDQYPIPGGKPVITVASLALDLQRRDFTANAVAAFPDRDDIKIVDLTGGLGDIAIKTLRPIGPETLLEDPVRLLRGARYLHRLQWQPVGDHWDLGVTAARHPETWEGIEKSRVWREIRLLADELNAPPMYRQLSQWQLDLALFGRPLSPALLQQLAEWRARRGPEHVGTGRNWLIDLVHIQRHIPEIVDHIARLWPPPQDEFNRLDKLLKAKPDIPDDHWYNKTLIL